MSVDYNFCDWQDYYKNWITLLWYWDEFRLSAQFSNKNEWNEYDTFYIQSHNNLKHLIQSLME